jgi:DNA polymerase-3 subunit beta
MKFVVLKDNLNKALTIVGRNISNRPQLPILSNIYIKAENNQVTMAVTNLEIGIVFTLNAKIEKEGEITVPGKLLADFVKNLTDEKIEFNLEGTNLIVKTTTTHASFTTIPTTDFPPFPTLPQTKKTFPFKKIKEAILKTVFAASIDEGRPILTGVKTVLTGTQMVLSATDGYRLSIDKIEVPKQNEDLKVVLPAQALSEVIRIAQEIKAEELEFATIENKNQAVFMFSGVVIYTRLIDGEFPNVEKIIPLTCKTKVTLDKELFAQSVKTASLFARGAANIIKIKIEKNGLRLSANTPQVGEDEDFVEAKVEGEETEIAFNYRFLLDLLTNFPDKELVFETSGALNPGVFKPVANNSSFLHLIMPVRIQG